MTQEELSMITIGSKREMTLVMTKTMMRRRKMTIGTAKQTQRLRIRKTRNTKIRVIVQPSGNGTIHRKILKIY